MQRNIFKQGFLSEFSECKMRKEPIEKLTTSHLMRIATILGHLSKDYDLYNLLFEQPAQTLKVDGIEVNTRDLAMFIILDHKFTRGYFSDPKGRATSDTTMCQGVPLALEGAKRVHDKTYMSWLEGLDHKDMSSLIRCDIFLPAHLASLDIDDESGEVIKLQKYGLIMLYINKIEFPITVIKQLREQVTNWLSTHTPKIVDSDLIDGKYGEIYNNCEHKLRCLILQGWVWGAMNKVRNPSMITDIFDWDHFATDLSNRFEGYTVKSEKLPGGLLKFMHDTPEEYDMFREATKAEAEKDNVHTEDNLTI